MITYTPPIIRRGKLIKTVKKGITLAEQQALQDWYIEYYFTDTSLGIINKRIKLRSNLNKFTKPNEKERKAQELLQSISQLLDEGWHPFNEDANTLLRNEIVSLSVSEAIIIYMEHLKENSLRKKSVQTYDSKLKYFSNYFTSLKVNQINDLKMNVFLKEMQSKHSWSNKTFNAAHQVLNALYTYLVRFKYVEINPVKLVPRLKSISASSDAHRVFTDEDFKTILEYTARKDAFTDVFIKTIYYTCIRPKELRQIKLSMIDFKNNIITVPGSISKNKQTATVKITPNFRSILEPYELDQLPKDFYLFASNSTVGGLKPVGENTPYNRFMACLKRVNLTNKGYSLYGVKHKSNINKYLDGWSVAEIMKANRHG
ncbi:MAG: site-specific integrase, partial [Chryseobacterium sp.]